MLKIIAFPFLVIRCEQILASNRLRSLDFKVVVQLSFFRSALPFVAVVVSSHPGLKLEIMEAGISFCHVVYDESTMV